MRDKDAYAEQYWRERASTLRSEESTTLAQIDYVRAGIAEILRPIRFPHSQSFWPFVRSVSELSVSKRDKRALDFNTSRRRFPNNRGRFDRFRGRGRFNNVFGGNLVALPYEQYDYTYERAELVKQLDELQLRNTALRVRWRDLEDERDEPAHIPAGCGLNIADR